MSKFKDRAGRGLNKRILEVESVERNQAGEISKIYAKVSEMMLLQLVVHR